MSDEAVESARALVLEYGFDEAAFDKMVDSVRDQLEG